MLEGETEKIESDTVKNCLNYWKLGEAECTKREL